MTSLPLFVFALAAASGPVTGDKPHAGRAGLVLSLPTDMEETQTPKATPAPVAARPALVDAAQPKPKPTPPAAAAPPTPPRKACSYGCLTPVEAVTFADTVAPRAGIAGEFDLTIASIGEQQGRYYLNSEEDYRERNCLSIVLAPNIVQSLIGSTSLSALATRMKGKRVAVQGIARRVRIDLTDKGQNTGKYYYQVHVVVSDPKQIVLN